MIYKLIKATAAPGCKEALIQQQRAWNDSMAGQSGFLGVQVATDPSEPDAVYMVIAMETRADLERFMAGDHDAVADQTGMKDLYTRLDIHVLDVVEPGPPALRLEVAPSRTSGGYQVAMLSELYRASALLRVAVTGGIFDAIGEAGASVDDVAAALGAGAGPAGRLLEGLGALNLVREIDGRVSLTGLARDHLLTGARGYIGDLVLHNTRPALWQRWGSLGATLGLPSRPGAADRTDHELFLDAMTSVARGGQASSLLAAVDLSGCRRLLDVGGAHGDYSVALCHAWDSLDAVVLDQPGSVESTRSFLAAEGMTGRIDVRGGDYREDLGGTGFDAVLLSNVLRGETLEQAAALLRRAAGAMAPGGLLIVQDLFPEDLPGHGPLLAAFFGLHLPDACNCSVGELRALLAGAGFTDVTVSPLDGWVVSNRVVTGRPGTA